MVYLINQSKRYAADCSQIFFKYKFRSFVHVHHIFFKHQNFNTWHSGSRLYVEFRFVMTPSPTVLASIARWYSWRVRKIRGGIQ